MIVNVCRAEYRGDPNTDAIDESTQIYHDNPNLRGTSHWRHCLCFAIFVDDLKLSQTT